MERNCLPGGDPQTPGAAPIRPRTVPASVGGRPGGRLVRAERGT